jgi:hypothetical protein
LSRRRNARDLVEKSGRLRQGQDDSAESDTEEDTEQRDKNQSHGMFLAGNTTKIAGNRSFLI